MGELTGTKYCKGCEYFHHQPDIEGVYCVLPLFDGMCTKECPKRKAKEKE